MSDLGLLRHRIWDVRPKNHPIHGTGHPDSLPFACPIGQSSIVTIYPANGWQKCDISWQDSSNYGKG
jgi:hypothetical protein